MPNEEKPNRSIDAATHAHTRNTKPQHRKHSHSRISRLPSLPSAQQLQDLLHLVLLQSFDFVLLLFHDDWGAAAVEVHVG